MECSNNGINGDACRSCRSFDVTGILFTNDATILQVYKIDFSDVPSIIALFSLGLVSAALVEVIKLIVKVVTVGTNTDYVGELANLLGIVLFILPTWFVYKKMNKTTKL